MNADVRLLTQVAEQLFADPVLVVVVCGDGHMEAQLGGSARAAGHDGMWAAARLRQVAEVLEGNPRGGSAVPTDVVDR